MRPEPGAEEMTLFTPLDTPVWRAPSRSGFTLTHELRFGAEEMTSPPGTAWCARRWDGDTPTGHTSSFAIPGARLDIGYRHMSRRMTPAELLRRGERCVCSRRSATSGALAGIAR